MLKWLSVMEQLYMYVCMYVREQVCVYVCMYMHVYMLNLNREYIIVVKNIFITLYSEVEFNYFFIYCFTWHYMFERRLFSRMQLRQYYHSRGQYRGVALTGAQHLSQCRGVALTSVQHLSQYRWAALTGAQHLSQCRGVTLTGSQHLSQCRGVVLKGAQHLSQCRGVALTGT